MTTKVTIENPEDNEFDCELVETDLVLTGATVRTPNARHHTIIPPGAKTTLHIFPTKTAFIREVPRAK